MLRRLGVRGKIRPALAMPALVLALRAGRVLWTLRRACAAVAPPSSISPAAPAVPGEEMAAHLARRMPLPRRTTIRPPGRCAARTGHDPGQLRPRLSAFQTAAAHGRDVRRLTVPHTANDGAPRGATRRRKRGPQH